MAEQKEITAKEAIEIIGNALAHDSLKLSQGDHLALVKCYKVVKEKIDKCECERNEKAKTFQERLAEESDKKK